MVDEALRDMTVVAAHFQVGDVVRRRLSRYFVGSVIPDAPQ